MEEEKKEEKRKYSSLSNYRYIYGELWRYDKKVILCAIAEILLQVTVAFGGILLPAAVIGMLEAGNDIGEMIGKILLLFSGYGIICALSTFFVQRNSLQYVDFRAGHLMRKACRKVMEIDYVQYEDEEKQKLLKNAQEALAGNNWGLEGILHDTVTVATGILGLVFYAGLISNVSPWIVIMLVFISMIQIACYRAANRFEMSQKDQKATLQVTQKYLDKQAYDVGAGKDVRIYQLKEWLTEKYCKANDKYRALVAGERKRYFANDLAGLFLQFFRDIICYGYLIRMLKGGGMAVSDFVLYIGVIAGFSTYFSNITEKISEIGRFQKMVDFLREFMDISPVFHHGTGDVLPEDEATLEVTFDHVSFSYPGSDKKVLDDISFTMKKGEKIALVGINGAGKTTIVKLICGFYHPTEGRIIVNDVDLEDLDLDRYHKELAVVFQDAFTYSYSIGENVTCLQEGEYDRDACISAIKQAGLWQKVDSLQKKEKTCLNKDVEEDGIQLSGGQQQKLMLARALYRNCRLLLLDEPTAALDAIAENEMYEKYEELIAGKTALFISHRLASTRFCDKILFLENGKIVEEGTHESLMKDDAGYAHMFEVQSQYYKEGKEENEADMA